MLNHYDLLGVPKTAELDEIKKAYRAMSKKHHPDLNGTGSQALFAAVNEAYQVLSTPSKKEGYDRDLQNGSGPSAQENHTSKNSSPQQESGVNEEEHFSDEIRQTAVDWHSYSWFGKKYEGVTERLTKKHPYLAKRYFSAAGYFFVASIAVVLMIFVGILENDLSGIWKFALGLGVILAQGFLFKLWTEGSFGKKFSVFNISQFLLSAFLAYWGLTQAETYPWLLAIFAVLTFVMGFISHKYDHLSYLETPRIFSRFQLPKKDILEAYQWGEAGNLDDAIDKFGEENVHKGATGEKYTEELLQYFGAIPGVRVMHGLKFLGSKNADVDHVLISGRNVIFIDSKQWSPGKYSWNEDGTIYQQAGKRSYKRTTNFKKAVDDYRNKLPMRANVMGIVLIHGTNIEVSENSVYGSVLMANTVDGIDYIGNLISNEPTGEIDYYLLNPLVNCIKGT